MGCFVRVFRVSRTLETNIPFRKCRHGCPNRLVNPPFRNRQMQTASELPCSPCVFRLAVHHHACEATHLSFEEHTWFGNGCCRLVSGLPQEPRRDPRGAGHVRCRMSRPDAAPRCVRRQELRHRVRDLPSSPRRSPRQGGEGRIAARGHHAVLEIQPCANSAGWPSHARTA